MLTPSAGRRLLPRHARELPRAPRAGAGERAAAREQRREPLLEGAALAAGVPAHAGRARRRGNARRRRRRRLASHRRLHCDAARAPAGDARRTARAGPQPPLRGPPARRGRLRADHRAAPRTDGHRRAPPAPRGHRERRAARARAAARARTARGLSRAGRGAAGARPRVAQRARGAARGRGRGCGRAPAAARGRARAPRVGLPLPAAALLVRRGPRVLRADAASRARGRHVPRGACARLHCLCCCCCCCGRRLHAGGGGAGRLARAPAAGARSRAPHRRALRDLERPLPLHALRQLPSAARQHRRVRAARERARAVRRGPHRLLLSLLLSLCV